MALLYPLPTYTIIVRITLLSRRFSDPKSEKRCLVTRVEIPCTTLNTMNTTIIVLRACRTTPRVAVARTHSLPQQPGLLTSRGKCDDRQFFSAFSPSQVPERRLVGPLPVTSSFHIQNYAVPSRERESCLHVVQQLLTAHHSIMRCLKGDSLQK